jgi:GntR family transcriptional repressor for pyruvate dehydrogenase complex
VSRNKPNKTKAKRKTLKLFIHLARAASKPQEEVVCLTQVQSNDEKSIKTQFVVKHIGQILSGELPPETKLPPERHIAESMRISRNIVREGLSELAALGFLSIEARKGAYVKDCMMDGNLLTLDAICKAGFPIPAEMLKGMLDMRMELLCESAGRSALLRTEKDLDQMGLILLRQDRLSDSQHGEFAQLDFLFHKQILMSSGNVFYPVIFNSVREIHQALAISYYMAYPDKEPMRDLHKKTLMAIAERNPDAARSWTRKSLEMAAKLLEENNYADARLDLELFYH